MPTAEYVNSFYQINLTCISLLPHVVFPTPAQTTSKSSTCIPLVPELIGTSKSRYLTPLNHRPAPNPSLNPPTRFLSSAQASSSARHSIARHVLTASTSPSAIWPHRFPTHLAVANPGVPPRSPSDPQPLRTGTVLYVHTHQACSTYPRSSLTSASQRAHALRKSAAKVAAPCTQPTRSLRLIYIPRNTRWGLVTGWGWSGWGGSKVRNAALTGGFLGQQSIGDLPLEALG